MAQPQTTRGRYFALLLGNGASPEVFTKTCMFTSSLGLELSKETASTVVRDCTDPEIVPWAIVDAVSKSATISGEGFLDQGAIATFMTWYDGVEAKNVQLEIYDTGATGGIGELTGTFSGSAHIGPMTINAPDAERSTISATLTFTGPVSYAE